MSHPLDVGVVGGALGAVCARRRGMAGVWVVVFLLLVIAAVVLPTTPPLLRGDSGPPDGASGFRRADDDRSVPALVFTTPALTATRPVTPVNMQKPLGQSAPRAPIALASAVGGHRGFASGGVGGGFHSIHGGGQGFAAAGQPAGPALEPFPMPPELAGVRLSDQPAQLIAAKSAGCVACHQNVGDPHGKSTVRLGCVDCHGGNAAGRTAAEAHATPRYPEYWRASGNPVRSYTLLNHESPEFIRFVNPGDLRVAHISCGTTGCHASTVDNVRKSMMTHGAMLWGAALYNNGAIPFKQARYGESYSMNGVPLRMQTVPPPTPEETRLKGILPYLDPLPKFMITQPGNLLRIFERGGRFKAAEVGLPEVQEEPGRPRTRLSDRGVGTNNRTDPVFIGLQKTRLLDPTLNFLGTNDHPGDYRSSGCTACHMVYANDRSPVHSGSYAKFGNQGRSFSPDPMIPKNEPGHPIDHKFVWAPPTSQCIVCHMHPGTTVLNEYLGFQWWDLETDAEFMYPREEKTFTAEEFVQGLMNDPNEASMRGNWSDPEFLQSVTSLNPQLKKTQFADFHGHGWMFSAVFKKDREGNLLDSEGNRTGPPTSEILNLAMLPPSDLEKAHSKAGRQGVPLHLMDIHMEKGMHCVDCHFTISGHGNGKLYGEVRNAIEIQCIDCHGTSATVANLKTSGPASPPGGMDLAGLRTPSGKRRFEWINGKLMQRSLVERNQEWEVVQTKDTVTPGSAHYNEKSHLAKTVRFNARGLMEWGLPAGADPLKFQESCAHKDKEMSCIACHSSWNPSCFGCHLSQIANIKTPELHNQGTVSRNMVKYNFQTLRNDVFMLAKDGTVTGNRIGPARSSCAIHVGSYNGLRESIYVQQQTISAEGLSGIAFSVNVPHTVRGGPTTGRDGRAMNPVNYLPGRNETKQCTDCHVSAQNDNNAVMAQLLMQGTNYTNFLGRYAWVAAGEEGLLGVTVTERDEPQTVIGSAMHATVYPQRYEKHLENDRELTTAHEHAPRDVLETMTRRYRDAEVYQVQSRGEYLYAACGTAGLKVFDIAFIDNKAFSERIVTAPVSPMGQKFFVRTKDCRDVAAPTTLAPDPTRTHRPENEEQKVHSFYAYLYLADHEEGLILVGAATLLDGNPLNNFLERALTFNPDGLLKGARKITPVGTNLYICCDAGLVVLDMNDPTKPVVTAVLGPQQGIVRPRAVQAQFRYAFVADAEGVKTLNIDDLLRPTPVQGAYLPLPGVNNIYVARTYLYAAAGPRGLVIVNVTNPERPLLDRIVAGEGCLNDTQDVKLGITYNSAFAYVADGRNGLIVVQLTSPETPGNDGFAPRPTPTIIARHHIPNNGRALAVSEGVDRDRAVDENGNQIAVFGRVGARPFNQREQEKFFKHNGAVFRVSDDPRSPYYRYVGPVGPPKP